MPFSTARSRRGRLRRCRPSGLFCRSWFPAPESRGRTLARCAPWGRLVALLASPASRAAAGSSARSLARAAPAAQKIEVLGPAEAPLAVIRGRFRFRLLVKAAREADLQA